MSNTESVSGTRNGYGVLRSVLETAHEESGYSRGDLTVLSAQVDPYRLDTPSGHRDGKWAAAQLKRAFGKERRTHWRGLHYAIVARGNVRKPDGGIYRNTDIDWNWLVGEAFQFVIFGEKGSLEEVLLPLARYYEADLYLPSGEISDSLLHRIAKDAAKDGRPLVVITISDCDPAGHQMPVSIGRKLQALHDLLFPNLKFEVVPAALTVDQVRDLDLPSTPLKETEKRASRWREAFGVEQTEIDALATLRPDDLREIVDGAFDPYFDRTLKARVDTAEQEWLAAAETAMAQQIDDEVLSDLREQAAGRLEELRAEIDRINEQLHLVAADHISLPEIEVPQPEIDDETPRQALVLVDQEWVEATRALITRKSYET